MKNVFQFAVVFFGFLLVHAQLRAQLILPTLFSDNMVVQRGKPVRVWGWATTGSRVFVRFNGQSRATRVGKDGRWEIVFNPMQHGGPFEMTVNAGKETKILHNILIGDVWICSGQSNMEMPIQGWGMDSVRNAKEEIATANYPDIRLMTVEKAMSYVPEADFKSSGWKVCSPATVGPFSAVGYFFGRKLNQELGIPIGLIYTAWGGTVVQAWTSWDEMGKLPEYADTNPVEFISKAAELQKRVREYETALKEDQGTRDQWFRPDTDLRDWKPVTLPRTYEDSEIGDVDGVVWFCREFELKGCSEDQELNLGAIDDAEETWINGEFIGKTDGWNVNRRYRVRADLLKSGTNVLVVKVLDTGGGGGFKGTDKDLWLGTESNKISLAGNWYYREAATTKMFDIQHVGPNSFPSRLYNAMIAPAIRFPIKGVIWYQGESNTWEAYRYRTLFPSMINDWRRKWGYAFPFYWVQLANFMKPDSIPVESEWAELREAQSKTLSLPNTGQAVTIDIGEADDIHPRNKQDVGGRLALNVLHHVYRKTEIVASGPVYSGMEARDGKIYLSFTHIGSGLVAGGDKYGYLRGFSIATENGPFLWAKAHIEGDRVVVYHPEIKAPAAVRYAWGNNPDDANLFNREGLPASPFRTDSRKGVTGK